MNKLVSSIVMLFVALPALCLAAPITQEEIMDYLNWQTLTESFTADLTSTLQGPARTVTRNSKIYKRGTTLLRIDTEPSMLKALPKKPEKPLGDLVVIRNLDTKKAYLVFPERKAYVEASTEQLKHLMEQVAGQLQQKVDPKQPNLKNCEQLGSERLEGVKCDKVHCRAKLKNGGESDITAWLMPDYNNFPMKTVIKTTMPNGVLTTHTSKFHNIKRVPPSKKKFAVSADYKKYPNLVQLATEGKGGQRMQERKKRMKQRRQQQR
ncbi:hypothetical protein ACFL43_02860 [Thermodesulfobacteriota bacterium]